LIYFDPVRLFSITAGSLGSDKTRYKAVKKNIIEETIVIGWRIVRRGNRGVDWWKNVYDMAG
jgi:hypothetical protein